MKVRHIPEGKRFELDLNNNEKAVVVYAERNGKLYLTHSEVPYSMRGQGVGRKLVIGSFEIIAKKNLRAVSTICFEGATMDKLTYAVLRGMNADLSKVKVL